MTLEECKKLHKDMWEFVKEKENLTDEDRHYLKASYCALNGERLVNHCALCSYAQQKHLNNMIMHILICASIVLLYGARKIFVILFIANLI